MLVDIYTKNRGILRNRGNLSSLIYSEVSRACWERVTMGGATSLQWREGGRTKIIGTIIKHIAIVISFRIFILT